MRSGANHFLAKVCQHRRLCRARGPTFIIIIIILFPSQPTFSHDCTQSLNFCVSACVGRQARDKLLSAVESMTSQPASLEIQVLNPKGVQRLEQERIGTISTRFGISRTASRELLNSANWDMDIEPSPGNETSSVGGQNCNVCYLNLVKFFHMLMAEHDA